MKSGNIAMVPLKARSRSTGLPSALTGYGRLSHEGDVGRTITDRDYLPGGCRRRNASRQGSLPITGKFLYGKPIPLPEVNEQIRGILLVDKQKEAIAKYVWQL